VSYLVKRLVQANSESAVDKEETAQVEMTFEYVDFVEMPENLDYLRSSCVCVVVAHGLMLVDLGKACREPYQYEFACLCAICIDFIVSFFVV